MDISLVHSAESAGSQFPNQFHLIRADVRNHRQVLGVEAGHVKDVVSVRMRRQFGQGNQITDSSFQTFQ